ncbi:MAG TPA: DUF4386 domain-containing protein [Candidatus Acidoferrales bacterium]|jgi:hypothetical protein|nr:DUF4386 domain-containing protein [Candidatus Acidoferrales bacterium]
MTGHTDETSPQISARIAGFLYLIIIALGLFAEVFVRERVLVNGDAAATARNILAHEQLYRLGFAAGIIVCICGLPLTIIFYNFFKLVNRSLALLEVFFALVTISIESVSLLNHFAPLILLGGERYLSAFNAEQLQALGYMSLVLQSVGYNLSLAVFAFDCMISGYLIFKSTFFPRILGVLLAMAGLSYLINSFASFLAPAFAGQLFPYILVPSFIGELSVCLWLLVMGVNVPKWKEKATAWRAGEPKPGIA